jgi:hypothetical protein
MHSGHASFMHSTKLGTKSTGLETEANTGNRGIHFTGTQACTFRVLVFLYFIEGLLELVKGCTSFSSFYFEFSQFIERFTPLFFRICTMSVFLGTERGNKREHHGDVLKPS